MACNPESKSAEAAGGCCGGGCGAPKAFPWFSALCDPAFQKLFLARYWRDLLTGLAAGGLGALALLAPGEALAGLGPLLGGPWLHLRAAAVLPAAMLAGLLGLPATWAGWWILARAGRDRTPS